jgi:hypothetical protein
VAKLIGPAGELIAIVAAEHGEWRLARVLAAPSLDRV